MSHTGDDPDDIVRKKIDLNHITKMSYQMHVPDSITVGPNRSAMPRLDFDDQIPVRMEVPDRLRPGGNGSMIMLNEADFFAPIDPIHSLTNSIEQQPSLPSTLHPKDIENISDDDDLTTITKDQSRPPIKMAESWHVEPYHSIDDKSLFNKLQLLQNRVHHIERTLAKRDNRDRLVYLCIFGYFLVQVIRSVRRSIFN